MANQSHKTNRDGVVLHRFCNVCHQQFQTQKSRHTTCPSCHKQVQELVSQHLSNLTKIARSALRFKHQFRAVVDLRRLLSDTNRDITSCLESGQIPPRFPLIKSQRSSENVKPKPVTSIETGTGIEIIIGPSNEVTDFSSEVRVDDSSQKTAETDKGSVLASVA